MVMVEPALVLLAELALAVVAEEMPWFDDSAWATDCRLVAAGGVYCTTEEDTAEREADASTALLAYTLTVVVV